LAISLSAICHLVTSHLATSRSASELKVTYRSASEPKAASRAASELMKVTVYLAVAAAGAPNAVGPAAGKWGEVVGEVWGK